VSKIWKWSIKGEYNSGVQTVNSLHFVTQVAEFGSEPSAHDILVAVNTKLYNPFLNVCPTSWNQTLSEVSEVLAPGDLTGIPEGAAGSAGGTGNFSEGDHILPEALTCIVSLQTGVPRRWARGYIALPCPKNSGALTNLGRWTGSYLTTVQTLAALLDDTYSLGSVNPTVVLPIAYSRVQHARGADQPWAQITSGVPRTVAKWRRSRLSAP
jgi:hypothetical protein